MQLDEDLLKILVCPDSKLPVQLATQAMLQDLNTRIAKGELRTKTGVTVTEKLEAGLLRSDGKILYPVREGIPVMLVDEGILI
ncbi:MAG: hypothetical protein K1X79_12180 [Oligoflexia bacterium]|nr:hypothetical protein [Oligoflexia bacterium]